MLPNWLYGKSKSKLASILGGGGGAPADYDQVKAQVTQNAEDIALLDTENQTLTQQANAMVNMSAKNALNNTGVDATTVEVAWTVNRDKTVTAVVSSTIASERNFRVYSNAVLPLETGEYIISGNPSASTRIVIFDADSGANIANTSANGEISFTYTKGHKIFVTLYISSSVTAQTFKFSPMIRDARIIDSTYVPYAMTNQELTEKLTSDANLDTAVDLSAYTAYSNMYTAPSDGYVHFQSAESGSTARTIYTYGNNTTAATDPHFTHSTSANNKAFEIYVRKGLKIYADGLQSGDTINFYPLT